MSDDGSEADSSEADVMDGRDVCRLTSVLARLGIATDLATLWRLPYMCHKYGGKAPYMCYSILLPSVRSHVIALSRLLLPRPTVTGRLRSCERVCL